VVINPARCRRGVLTLLSCRLAATFRRPRSPALLRTRSPRERGTWPVKRTLPTPTRPNPVVRPTSGPLASKFFPWSLCLSGSYIASIRCNGGLRRMRMQAAHLVVLLSGLASTKNLQGQIFSRGQAVGIIAGNSGSRGGCRNWRDLSDFAQSGDHHGLRHRNRRKESSYHRIESFFLDRNWAGFSPWRALQTQGPDVWSLFSTRIYRRQNVKRPGRLSLSRLRMSDRKKL